MSEGDHWISVIIIRCEEALWSSYKSATPLTYQKRRALLTTSGDNNPTIYPSALTNTELLLAPPLHLTVILCNPTIPMPTTTLPRPTNIPLPLPFLLIPTRQIGSNPLPRNAVIRGIALCKGRLAAKSGSGEGIWKAGGAIPLRR